jgi:hypothetical protein
LIPHPRETFGGFTSNIMPNRATTTPSLHFSVAPPRKQAATGNAGTAKFNHQRPGAPVKLAATRFDLVLELGMGAKRRLVVVWD